MTKELTISFVVIALIILLVAAFGMGRRFRDNGVYSDSSRGVSVTTRQIDTAPPSAGKKVSASNTTPTNDMLKILSPKKGDLLCLKNPFEVVWQVPEDMPALTIKIAEAANGDTIHDIGSFPSDYQGKEGEGRGMFTWVVGDNKDKAVIEPGAAYHILIQGTYNGWFLSSASEYFSISDCE